MAIARRFCSNHPQRAAIGVCVITGAAICGECSTRYEGVNYSKEGLAILHRRRAEAGKRSSWPLTLLAWAVSPVLLALLYLAYRVSAALLTNFVHS